MLVLGVESSCDETAAAVVADGERILSSVVASQVLTHEKYGGVVPELASREHLRNIVPVVEEACRLAGVDVSALDGLAVTEGPGLIGSLLVGLVYGKALASALSKPLVGVNHLEGHIHAVLLESKMARATNSEVEEPRFPAVALVVSGGHTALFLVAARRGKSPLTFSYTLLGQTRDDAAGEAFDKVAKLLALGYPGGPIIDRLAAFGTPGAAEFGRIRMRGNPLDFSFSGLKTAVLYRVRPPDHQLRKDPPSDGLSGRSAFMQLEAESRRAWSETAGRPPADEIRAQCSQATLDLVAGFQRAVVTDLVERTLAAAEMTRVQSILVSGGVACNSLLRERFAGAGEKLGLRVHFPSPALSTDNAAMIAAAGYYKLAAGQCADASITAHASLPLGR